MVSMLPNGQIVSDLCVGDGALFDVLRKVPQCWTAQPSMLGRYAAFKLQLQPAACHSWTPLYQAARRLRRQGRSVSCVAVLPKPLLSPSPYSPPWARKSSTQAMQAAAGRKGVQQHAAGDSYDWYLRALSMGARNGLDPAALSEIMRASSGNNWSLDVYNPYPGVMPDKPASNDFRPGFMTRSWSRTSAWQWTWQKKASST